MKNKPEAVSPKDEHDYECDSAVDTLIRAEEIKSNKELMARVEKKLAKKHSAIKSIRDLKDVASAMDEEGRDNV